MRMLVILLPAILALGACSGTSSPDTSTSAASAASNSDINGTPAPGSKFSEIHIGMDKTEVQSVIGRATDESAHDTGKAFIPLYFGADTTEIDAHYKGEGVLTYASQAVGSNLYLLKTITVNISETGYMH
jgi:hypothetical protein